MGKSVTSRKSIDANLKTFLRLSQRIDLPAIAIKRLAGKRFEIVFDDLEGLIDFWNVFGRNPTVPSYDKAAKHVLWNCSIDFDPWATVDIILSNIGGQCGASGRFYVPLGDLPYMLAEAKRLYAKPSKGIKKRNRAA